MRTARAVTSSSVVCILALLVGGCEKKASTSSEAEQAEPSDAGAGVAAAVDPSIAQAVAAVAEQGAQGGSPQSTDGPPPSGVFAPGRADAEATAGAPAKLSLAGSGQEPRRALPLPRPAPKLPLAMQVEFGVRMGPRSARPTLAVELRIEAEPQGGGEEDREAVGARGLSVVAKVVQVQLAAQQPGRLPPGMQADLEKLEGSRARYTLGPDGGISGYALEAAEAAPQGMAELLGPVRQALTLAALAYPSEPLGQGGVWMASHRERFAEMDVVAYRMMKLEQVDATKSVVAVDTRRYSAASAVELPGVPPNRLAQFEAPGRGQLVFEQQEGEARLSGQLADSMQAMLEPLGGGGPPGQMMRVQLDMDIRFSVERAKKKAR